MSEANGPVSPAPKTTALSGRARQEAQTLQYTTFMVVFLCKVVKQKMFVHEQPQRTESLQPFHEIASDLAHEMGEQPQQRLDWLMRQTGESLGNLMLRVNSTVLGLNPEEHRFDGENVRAGGIGGSIPPDQEDKIMLLGELVSVTQQHIRARSERGEDPQTIMSELAVAIPTVINKLHLFADGNGRTSRMLRMVLRDGDQLTHEKTEALVHKKGYEKYDTTPAGPIEMSVESYMRSVNGASGIVVIDDVVDENTFVIDQIYEVIEQKFPDISPKIINPYLDTANFSETVRLMGKYKGADTVRLSELFSQITKNPGELAKFTAVYRGVRKQRVELLIGGLTGEVPVPLSVEDKEKSINDWFNGPRTRMALPPIDLASINTIQDFQMAYCETFAPQRTAV